jgi:hypothetical protein
MHFVQRKLAIGLAVLTGTVGIGAGLAAAQTDGTTPPTTEAPASPPSDDQAPGEDRPRARDGRDCPEKGNRGGDGGTEGSSTNAVMRLRNDSI